MKMDDMIIISTDDHILEPPDLFLKTMSDKWKGRAPRVARYADGQERWLIGDVIICNPTFHAVAGHKVDEVHLEPTSYSQARKAAYDVHARIDDMNANGILSALNFGNIFGFSGDHILKVQDKDLALACVQAYNDWHVEQWCAPYPGRLIPMAILPLWDIGLCVQEVRRMAKKGVRVISFPGNPPGFNLPSVHKGYWDPLFKEVIDHDVTVAIHIGTTGAALHAPSEDSPMPVGGAIVNISIAGVLADLVFSPLLRKFPTLRIALAEGCMGWLPFVVERMDASYQKFGKTSGVDLGKETPRSIIDRQFLFCFHEDNFGLRHRHEVGLHLITVEVDYPHADATFPYTPEGLWRAMKDFPREEIDMITHGNAMRFFDFDPFKYIARKDATVGALRAQATHVDVTPKSMAGKAPERSGDVLSSGDVAKVFHTMNENLGEPVGIVEMVD